MSENSVVKACLDIFNAYNILAWRNNTGTFKTETGGYYKFGSKGSPDIIAVINGQFCGVEVKVKPNKQSESQKEFERKVRSAKGWYWLVYSPDELIEKLEKIKIK